MTPSRQDGPCDSNRWSRAFVALAFALMLGFAGDLPVAQAQLKVLYSFIGSDGQNPYTGLLRDAAGNLYGLTAYGGIYGNCDAEYGGGTVFQLDPAGKLTLLHAFNNVGDGCGPTSLILDARGNLYGTTSGTKVFKIAATGKFSVIYTFHTPSIRGIYPDSLFRDVQGNLYGTTGMGGDSACAIFAGTGCGTVFELDTSGKASVLYSFTGSPNGNYPQSGLIRDSGNNFFGTTTFGGNLACPNGCGTVFSVNKHGLETVLYSFTGGADGATPWTEHWCGIHWATFMGQPRVGAIPVAMVVRGAVSSTR